jgi:hypothetical protein
MKKSVLVVLAGLMMVLTGSGIGLKTALAADATAGVDFASAYVWRGITFNDEMVAQPYLDVTSGGFGFNVWGNLDIGDYDDTLDSGEFSEVDLTLSYAFDLDPVDITLGYIEYLFPAGAEGTREVFLGFSMDLAAGFSMGVTGFYDFDEVDDYYINASLGYAYDLGENLALGLEAGAGYAGDDASAGKDSGFHEYLLSADLAYGLTESVEVSAFIAWVDNFDDDVLPDQDTDLFGGVGISVGF